MFQVINKQNDGPFTAYDEKVFASYLQFCGIGLRNAQLYERSQLEVKRNQVLLDLARMVFEEQSTIEHMVLRILTHTQSLIRCQRVQVSKNLVSFSADMWPLPLKTFAEFEKAQMHYKLNKLKRVGIFNLWKIKWCVFVFQLF